jgi:hypothetical protein
MRQFFRAEYIRMHRRKKVYFLSCLPLGWTAVHKTSEFVDKTQKPHMRNVYVHRMVITPNQSAAPFPFKVKLRWTQSCGMMGLFFYPIQPFIPPAAPLVTRGLIITYLPGEILTFTPMSGPPSDLTWKYERYVAGYGPRHPFINLGTFLLRLTQRQLVEGVVLNALPAPVRQFVVNRQKREAALKDFDQTLRQRCPGWVKVYLMHSNKGDDRDFLLKYINRDPDGLIGVFGLTHVMPWAIYMLTTCVPNCVMTDATFEIMGPYVLEILQVIVRNVSIPIAAAVFPTETGLSYYRLYHHVMAILSENGVSPNELRKLPLVSDHGPGLGLFVNLINDLNDLENQLRGADDGAILTVLVLWLLCHRHLIENAGSGTLAGDWVRQLLECCTKGDAVEVALRVRLEIDKVRVSDEDKERFDDPTNHRVLKSILSAIQAELSGELPGLDLRLEWPLPRDPISMQQWARWLRDGCPTTSNALESIHRWLNTLLKDMGKSDFLTRYIKVVTYLQSRFDLRDSAPRVAGRSTVKFQKQKEHMGPPLSDHDKHLIAFMNALHGEPGKPWQESDDPRWKFPDYTPPDARTFRVDYCHIPDGERPPLSWLPDREKSVDVERARDFGLGDLDCPESEDPIPGGAQPGGAAGIDPVHAVNSSHYEAGWRIIRCVRRLVSDRCWQSRLGWKIVIPRVFEVGQPYLGMNPVLRQAEVDWKYDVFAELKIKIVVLGLADCGRLRRCSRLNHFHLYPSIPVYCESPLHWRSSRSDWRTETMSERSHSVGTSSHVANPMRRPPTPSSSMAAWI